MKLKMYAEANKKTILKSPHHSVAEFFERTVSGGMEEKLKEAAALAADAESVIFIGVGSSGILAEYGARYFSCLGNFQCILKILTFRPIPISAITASRSHYRFQVKEILR